MKHVNLPKHDDTTRGLLIDGPTYEGWIIYIPCTLSNGRNVNIPVVSRDGFGINIRKQPILLLPKQGTPEVAVATLHMPRVHTTKNINNDMPWLHIDDATVIDLTTDREGLGAASTRTGRVAYHWPNGREYSHILNRPISELRVGAEPIHHPELDAIAQSELDAAYVVLEEMPRSWKKLFVDHLQEKITIRLPGFATLVAHSPCVPDELPLVYCKYMHSGAGKNLSSTPFDTDYVAALAPARNELVRFIEMLSGMSSMISDNIQFTYDGATPSVTFRHANKTLELRVNDLPMLGRFLVIDPSKQDFDSKLSTYETLALALTAITTRLTQ